MGRRGQDGGRERQSANSGAWSRRRRGKDGLRKSQLEFKRKWWDGNRGIDNIRVDSGAEGKIGDASRAGGGVSSDITRDS